MLKLVASSALAVIVGMAMVVPATAQEQNDEKDSGWLSPQQTLEFPPLCDRPKPEARCWPSQEAFESGLNELQAKYLARALMGKRIRAANASNVATIRNLDPRYDQALRMWLIEIPGRDVISDGQRNDIDAPIVISGKTEFRSEFCSVDGDILIVDTCED
jgi:hypothetical protein